MPKKKLNNYFSIVEYFVSDSFKVVDAKAIGRPLEI